jgi:hypothetical protein
MKDQLQDQFFRSIISFQQDNEELVELHEKSESYEYELLTKLLTEHFPHWRTEKGIGSYAVQFLLETLEEIKNYDLLETDEDLDYGVRIELKVKELTEELLKSYTQAENYYKTYRESRDQLNFHTHIDDNFGSDEVKEEIRQAEWASFDRPKDEDVTVWF